MIEAVALYFVSEDCGQWANFLKTKLGEKAYDIRVHEIEAALASECEDSYKANIILASPAFLELQNYDHFCSIPKQQSLIVLLGVDESEFEAALKEREADTILGFPIFETEANESSVRCLLVEIIDLYERNVPTEDFMHHTNVPYDLLPAPKPIPVSANQLQKYIISERVCFVGCFHLCKIAYFSVFRSFLCVWVFSLKEAFVISNLKGKRKKRTVVCFKCIFPKHHLK